MRPLSESASRVAGHSLGKKYVALGRILDRWADIVGPDMALKAQPDTLRYHKYKEQKGKSVATLDIAVSTADATLLHYRKDLLLERINQIFGEAWIGDIRFVNKPANNSSHTPRRRLQKRDISPPDQKYLKEVLDCIADDEIRSRLEKLGQHILMEDKS